jgi:ABC-type transporter Mla MlaB component
MYLFPLQYFMGGAQIALINGQRHVLPNRPFQVEKDLVVLRISGRIAQDDVEILRAAIDQEQGAMVIDLEEISVVDRSAVDLLALSVARGVTLRNCPGYIREWITREERQP